MDLRTISKALAAAVAGALVAYLSSKGILVDSDALNSVLGALIAGFITYLAPKNKPS